MLNRLKKEDSLIKTQMLDSFYKKHLHGAYLRIGGSLAMWIFLLLAFILDIIPFDTFLNCTLCITYLIFFNSPMLFFLKRLKRIQLYRYFSFSVNALEIIGYTAIIYFLGGIKASFLTLQYAALITYVGVVSPRRTPFIIAGVSSICYASVVLLDYFGVIPHQNTLTPFVYDLKIQIMIVAVIIGYLYIIAFISSYIGNQIKRNREELRESERRYREHIENIGDVIYILDKKRRIKYVNKTLERLLGMSLDDLKYKKLHDIVALEPPRTVHTAIGGQKGAEKTGLFEVKYKDIGGVERIIEFQESLVREGKSIREIHGMGRDVTEKRKLENQVQQAQKMEAVVALAGGIAHNFNNILTGIMGYSEYLISEKKEDDPDYEALKTIHEGSIRASNLTKQLLDTARAEQFNLTNVNLNGVVEKLFPLISGTFDKSIELRTHLEENLKIIQGDVGQLEQSLLNLCINARDAMPSGGTLIIETCNQRLDKHHVKTHLGIEEGNYVVLSITDTGIGMSPEVKDRIFEPFFTTKEETGGTGMGLSTVYGIVQNHRGQITVYSEIGKGTTFKLYFPALEGARIRVPKKTKIDDRKGKGTILIIDDERAVRELWRDFLKKKGYRIITAEDGQRGIDIFRNSRDEIDLVILDLVMPKMGGEEALKRLREIRPNIKVLVSSGYSENGQAKEILKQGVNGFIHKPVRLTEIAERVRDVLNI